jgi:hypothetical protein
MLFDKFGLQARDPFRLRGEQIDGSFLLGSEIYLLEGKWQNAPSGIGHLHTFHGKVEQKAAWTRGLRSGGSKDPLIQALIQKLPSSGPWSADERVTWLKMLTNGISDYLWSGV